MEHLNVRPGVLRVRSAFRIGVAGAAIALSASQASGAIWSERIAAGSVRLDEREHNGTLPMTLDPLGRDVAVATNQKPAPVHSRPAPAAARPPQGTMNRSQLPPTAPRPPYQCCAASRPGSQPTAQRGTNFGGSGTPGGSVRTAFHSVRPTLAGRGTSPEFVRAARYNTGWEERSHYPTRREFSPPANGFGNPNHWREHFAYLPPQPFYQANLAAFVAFIPVPVGELYVAQVADAAPEDACVNQSAAQAVQSGNFYADDAPVSPMPGAAPSTVGPGGVVCNKVAINGVTQAQTEAAAAQLSDAAAQGQTSGTLSLQDEAGRPQQVPFRVEDIYTGVAEIDMPLLDGVEAPAFGASIPRNQFRVVSVKSHLRVRSVPVEQSNNITGEYDSGQIVQIQAITSDNKWALVAYGGFGVGYVSMSYLADAPAGTTASAVARPQRPKLDIAAAPTKARDLQTSNSSRPKFNIYKVHATAPCQTFVIDQTMRNQTCGFGGGTVSYNSDVPKLLQSGT